MREPATRISVDVTFLRMERLAPYEGAPLPQNLVVRKEILPDIAFYRKAYELVGGDYCWWLRRVMSDEALARVMKSPGWAMHTLRSGEDIVGFYEIEARGVDRNIAYFGLAPGMIGRHTGRPFLRHAIESAWAFHPAALTVNTCSADHPRALPLYLAAGFRKVRTITERWDIPDRLGMRIPQELRV